MTPEQYLYLREGLAGIVIITGACCFALTFLICKVANFIIARLARIERKLDLVVSRGNVIQQQQYSNQRVK